MLDELHDANRYIIDKIDNIKRKKNCKDGDGESKTFLEELEEYATEYNVPIVTKEVAEYLKFMVSTTGSKSILEVGSAIGYSTLLMYGASDGAAITTIEIDDERYGVAKKNFEHANASEIRLIHGDALEVLPQLLTDGDRYDFVFIDAAKGQYKKFFDCAYEMLEDGGMIFIDNIMFRGYLYKDDYPKRYKTMVKKLDKFIEYLYENHPSFTLLPFGDGVGMVHKKNIK